MKIAINALSTHMGGSATYLRNLIPYLDRFPDLEVVLFCQPNLKLPDHPRLSRPTVDWPIHNPFTRGFWERFIFPRTLAALKPDALFCPGGVLLTRTPPGCLKITMSRNMLPFDPQQTARFPLGYVRFRLNLLRGVFLRSMNRADLVIFISNHARDTICPWRGSRIREHLIIPHGINDHFRVDPERVPPRPDFLPQGDYLLYVSIMEVYKNHLELVRGYAQLRRMRPNCPRLVLVGPPVGWYTQLVDNEIEELGLGEHVIRTGPMPYDLLPAVYAHAAVNIFASSCENCPNILLEALGAGRPLLVSSAPPMPEFAGEAAEYFDPRDPRAFAEAAAALLDDPQRLDQLAANCRRQADEFSWERTATATWTAIRQLIEHHRGGTGAAAAPEYERSLQ